MKTFIRLYKELSQRDIDLNEDNIYLMMKARLKTHINFGKF